MICTKDVDCRHLSRDIICFCTISDQRVAVDPMLNECSCYETEGEYRLGIALSKLLTEVRAEQLEADLDWNESVFRSIRDGIIYALVTLAAFILFLWWMLW